MSETIKFDLDTIRQIADMVSEKDLGEITLKTENAELTVKGKKCVSAAVVPTAPVPQPHLAPAAAPATPQKTETPAAAGTLVKAPIVGTFYAASAPDQPPFVKVGDTVKKGDVLFIIESMKLMNEVQSEVEGVVKEILVGNGEAVEYDQPILRVE